MGLLLSLLPTWSQECPHIISTETYFNAALSKTKLGSCHPCFHTNLELRDNRFGSMGKYLFFLLCCQFNSIRSSSSISFKDSQFQAKFHLE